VNPRKFGGRDDRFPTSRPLAVDGGLRARSRRGDIGQSWWSARFLSGLEAMGIGGRLARGKNYARAGQVVELTIATGSATALVQGSRPRPYRVRIGLAAFGKADWARVEQGLADDAWYAAKLLAGEMPPDIEDAFAAVGLALLPAGARDLSMDCSCPDFAVPCKHLAACLFLLAESFDEDPFLILALRGRSRADLLENLQARRGGRAPGAADPAASGAPALADCLDVFWTAPARPPAPPPAQVAVDSLLDQVPAGGILVRGRDVVDLLRSVYQRLAGPTDVDGFPG
jgi:uncharacterized Zn finger protein